MSFFSGSTKSLPVKTKDPLGVNDYNGATNQRANPVAYFTGIRRFAPTWISSPFNSRADAVSEPAGKDSERTSGYNYYASIAALLCHGPVDALYALYANNDKIWGSDEPYAAPALTRSGADSVNITIPNFGQIRFYWGTETQAPDAVLNATGTAHPAYRGLCYFTLNQWFLGYNQTNFQNLEFVVGRWPQPAWFTPAANLSQDHNPAAFLADLLQNPRAGLGLPEELLDTAGFNAAGAQLESEGLGFSPLLTSREDVSQLLTDALQYFDGHPAITPDGRLGLRLIRPPSVPLDLPTITDADLTEKPVLRPADWSTASNQTALTFSDRGLAFQQNVKTWRDRGQRSITSQPDPLDLQWLWLTRGDLAQALANFAGRAAAVPELRGTLQLRLTDALFNALVPGAAFRLDYTQRPLPHLILRVVDRAVEGSAAPEFQITFTADRSYLFNG